MCVCLYLYLVFVPLWRTRPLFKAYVEFKKVRVLAFRSWRCGFFLFYFVLFPVKKYIIIEIVLVIVSLVFVVVLIHV